jgi:hypothetical protein
MGPAVLITLGVLFLLSEGTPYDWLEFHHTWPALLIVIGLVLFLQHSAPATGHVPREYAVPPAAPGYSQSTVSPGAMVKQSSPVVTPPPAQPGGTLPPPGNPGGATSGNPEANHG